MSTPRDFNIKPFIKGCLLDIPTQFMPTGGLTRGVGVRIDDHYIERRKGFRSILDCEYDDYILGMYQYLDQNQVAHLFFGTRSHLYHYGKNILRYWDDGYPWWDNPGYIWDGIAGGVVYELTPWGSIQNCPLPSVSSSSESSSSSSESESSSSVSSFSNSSSQSCASEIYPFTGRDHRDENGETSTWIFVHFAGDIIATNYEDPIVVMRGGAYDRYENLTCLGLRARIVDVFQNHILALNTVDDIDGTVTNRYWWSGLDDAYDWEYADLASECGYADLEPSSLPITGGGRLRDSYIIYQQNMIHQLNYTGGTLVFSRQVINNEIGCLSKGLLCGDGDKHFFFSQTDIHMFDGYSFRSIGMHNNDYIFGGLNKSQVSRAFSFIDVNTQEVHFVIPWNSDIPNLDCIYDYVHDLWTFDELDMNHRLGATAGCPKVAFDFPFIARVGVSASSSCSSSSSSSTSSSSSSCSLSSSSTSSSSESIPSRSVSTSSSSTSYSYSSTSLSFSSFSFSSNSRLECQEVCDCPFNYYITITGMSGSCDIDDCTELNGTFLLKRVSSCVWQGDVGGESNFGFQLWCDNGYWLIDVYNIDTLCMQWRTPNWEGCPPDDAVWQPISQSGCCNGRYSTMDLEPVASSSSTSTSVSSSSASSSSASESSSSTSSSSTSHSSSSSSRSSSSSSESSSSSSTSSSSSSTSSSSNSFSSEAAHADSFIQEVGSTDNDDDYPRISEWISGEYPSFTPEVPVDQYMKEIIEFTPLLVEIENDIHLSIGTRNKTSGSIEWEALPAFTDQTMYGTTSYGKYFSFQCVANAYDDYYKLSELNGQYVITGRR